MTDRVMVDIETLGLDPGAAILSIGAVRFDTDGLGATFERNIDLESCQEAGLTIDASTLEWWLQQDADAQHVLTGGESLADALEAFAEFYAFADEIWANSPAFDCEHLAAAYDAVDKTVPWEYYEQRDVRTITNLPVAPDIEQEGTEHDALDDAKYQATVVAETLAAINGEAFLFDEGAQP
jgi:hypothetical protein